MAWCLIWWLASSEKSMVAHDTEPYWDQYWTTQNSSLNSHNGNWTLYGHLKYTKHILDKSKHIAGYELNSKQSNYKSLFQMKFDQHKSLGSTVIDHNSTTQHFKNTISRVKYDTHMAIIEPRQSNLYATTDNRYAIKVCIISGKNIFLSISALRLGSY